MKYIGIDYGLKKIGIALSEGQTASAFKILDTSSLKDSVEKITHLIKEQNPVEVIIGVPDRDGAKVINAFIVALKKRIAEEKLGVEVVSVDETLSSVNARTLMIEIGKKKKNRKKEDAYAATLILQNYLDTLS